MQTEKQHWKDTYTLPYAEDTRILGTAVSIGTKTAPNRIVIQPMEGCDGTAEGAFDVLTRRRYERFAKSGAGLIWMEACAITEEGRANPRQLMLTDKTLDAFKREVAYMKETAQKTGGNTPLLILQATHSGRYAKPEGYPAPMIACNKPPLEGRGAVDPSRIVTDDYLRSLEEKYGHMAALAEAAGFDGVDIKCCHGYLMNELMSAYTRPGDYGGSLSNRTRLFYNAIRAAKAETTSDFLVTSRMNVYDGFPYPYGFGVSPDTGEEDLTEPLSVIGTLVTAFGFSLLDVTIGNPYVNPHVNRPFNHGPYASPEAPFAGVARMMHCVGAVQRAYPALTVIGSGFSYAGAEGDRLAAGAIKDGICKMAGFGRQSFAYPAFPRDILAGRGLDAKKCCIACGKCSELMRAGSVAGCVVRDREYTAIYQRDVAGKQ